MVSSRRRQQQRGGHRKHRVHRLRGRLQPVGPTERAVRVQPGGTNDALGLIANNYVEVNHPVENNTGNNGNDCVSSGGQHPVITCTGANAHSTRSRIARPRRTARPVRQQLPCARPVGPRGERRDPGTTSSSTQRSWRWQPFLHREQRGRYRLQRQRLGGRSLSGRSPSTAPSTRTGGGPSGISTSGYSKDYDWDSRLQLVTPPYYLNPGVQTWALDWSPTGLSNTPPGGSNGPGACSGSCT